MSSARNSDVIEIAVMRSLCKRFKTAFGRHVGESLSSGDKYLALALDPNAYTDAALFSKDLLLYSFLRKWKGWELDLDPDKVALDGWKTAEQKCFHTNHYQNKTTHSYGALLFISKVQRKIEQVIGKWPPDGVFDQCRWSSGATQNLKRGHTEALIKTSRIITITRPALKHLMSVMDKRWLEALPPVPYRIVDANRGVMVPKNAKTSRPIAAEPTGNAFLQQGIGRFIRKQLKAFGVNLDRQEPNQEAAFRAFVDCLATIDLSMASDTLSIATVRMLLPPEWFALLNDLRSPKTMFDGITYHLNKFSSMGNAFTFELESLIFWAISKVCCEEIDPRGTCLTYGDDIVVPQAVVKLLVPALTFFGFIVNTDKSFTSGVFFESCGKQYHSLEDVTPAFQKEVVGSSLTELIRLHNRLYRFGTRTKAMHLVKDALALIRKEIGLCHPKLKVVPEIPGNHPGDLGLLSDNCKVRRDGDYDCTVMVDIPEVLYAINAREIKGLFAYSLRTAHLRHNPTNDNYYYVHGDFGEGSNLLPDGHVGTTSGTRSVIRKQRIWAHSLQSA